MRKLLLRVDEYLLEKSAATIMLIAIFISAFLGILDYWTGFEATFSFFYLIPISITTWYIGFRQSLMISAICITIWTVINWLAGETYSHEIIRYWNAFIRLLLFTSISYLLYNLKIAIEHERTLSRTDFVTGIMNTREFHRLAETELLRSRRYHRSFSLAYIDLDNFKHVNDRFGHSVGDDLLKVVAKTILSNLRRTDYVARIGGDEFAILFPELDSASVPQAICKIQSRLTETMESEYPDVTMSIGVISCSSPNQSIDELLKIADSLMYEAKKQGKNQALFNDVP